MLRAVSEIIDIIDVVSEFKQIYGVMDAVMSGIGKFQSSFPQKAIRADDPDIPSEPFKRLVADCGVDSSISRLGNVRDNAETESFF